MKEEAKKKIKLPERKPFFNFVKSVLRPFIKKINVKNTNDSMECPAIFLCNHSGASSPLALEFRFNYNFRFCGTHEMNEGLRGTYRYLKNIYFSQKKHHGKFASWLLATVVCPISNSFYKGLQLISTYTDARLKQTFTNCFETFEKGKSIVIFPENSSKGYLEQPKEYYGGFFVLAKQYLQKFGKDLMIYNMHFFKKTRTLVIDKGIRTSELIALNLNASAIAEKMRVESNNLTV